MYIFIITLFQIIFKLKSYPKTLFDVILCIQDLYFVYKSYNSDILFYINIDAG
jgi:hypothetical protein